VEQEAKIGLSLWRGFLGWFFRCLNLRSSAVK